MTVETFFDEPDVDISVLRDEYDRPMLLPAGVTDERFRRPYTRASSLIDEVENGAHFHTWEKRYLARGMGMSPDLCDLAAAETYHTGLRNPLDWREKKASAARLDKIIERAIDRMKIHEKADYGSAVHALTEPGARERGATGSPAALADADSFFRELKRCGARIGATEVFTACDETGSAGTFDHLTWFPRWGVMVTDKKTGKMDPHHFAVQLAGYAHGDVYDPETDQRSTLSSLVNGAPVRRDYGVIAWIHDGKTELKLIDIAAGWEQALRCAGVRDYRARKDLMGDL